MYSSTKPQSSWVVVPFTVEPQSPFECIYMYVSPEWRLNLYFGTQKKGPFPGIEATTGGQKCCNLFSDISETSDLSPPTPNKIEFLANGWNDCFFGHNIAGGGGVRGQWDVPKGDKKKLSLGAESYITITWKGFFTQSKVVLHCRCPFNRGSKYKDYMNIFSGTRFSVPWMGVSQRRGCTAV